VQWVRVAFNMMCIIFFVMFLSRSRGILLLLLFYYYPLSRVHHNIIRVALIMRPPTCRPAGRSPVRPYAEYTHVELPGKFDLN